MPTPTIPTLILLSLPTIGGPPREVHDDARAGGEVMVEAFLHVRFRGCLGESLEAPLETTWSTFAAGEVRSVTVLEHRQAGEALVEWTRSHLELVALAQRRFPAFPSSVRTTLVRELAQA